jgi:light-regulated signal transduction histidine kinase (bacteriophytochrome)
MLEKNATISVTTLPVIKAVPLQMTQLFHNLISNALKFSKTDPAPVITIDASVPSSDEIRQLHLDKTMKYCKIVVQDNGIGFEQIYNEKIFNIFQRLHGKSEYSGTGIGLALCRKITDNHKGLILASSIHGNGATFSIYLPIEHLKIGTN